MISPGCDFIVVGSGIAALRAAIELAPVGHVVILTKGGAEDGSTGYAQGGIAAAMAADDSPALHAADTRAAGAGLCDDGAVTRLTEQGPRYVRELITWGARFDRDARGALAFGREGAHSVRRVLHARDATGREICRALWERLRGVGSVTVHDRSKVVAVAVEGGRCVGVRFRDHTGRLMLVRSRAVLLATGGAGQLYRETTNPPVATGDGVAMAYLAGASVGDLEFVQFHPTALAADGHPRFLLSEALRGEGAWLVNEEGHRFMQPADPAAELAPRDRVARGIAREIERTGGQVYLTLHGLPDAFVYQRFPQIAAACRAVGLDLARDRIPVAPAAHYVMGGVETDLSGRTSVAGLFAAGEVACTGVHGANRLASNSLLEGLVFGAEAGRAMATEPSSQAAGTVVVEDDRDDDEPARGRLPDEADLRDLMWRHVGLFRDRAGLTAAVDTLDRWMPVARTGVRGGARVASMIITSRLIAGAALRRTESRGAHYRSDFPDRNDIDWKRRTSDVVPHASRISEEAT